MELREKVAGLTRAAAAPQNDLYNGAGEGLNRAFELALTPAIIGGFGYLLDRWIGLLPVFTIIFFLVGMAGVIARMWYGYDAKMKEHEQAGPWARATSTATPGPVVSDQVRR
ncbi:MAG TPA: AtpZ/AtpI family protein [Acidimicrobiales bacterium]|nr:AtpZ/AtpI family protein [Acidimicrobiales bacterium]